MPWPVRTTTAGGWYEASASARRRAESTLRSKQEEAESFEGIVMAGPLGLTAEELSVENSVPHRLQNLAPGLWTA